MSEILLNTSLSPYFQELIPYSDLKVLVEESSDSAVQFKSLIKFLLNVYVKSQGQLKRVRA